MNYSQKYAEMLLKKEALLEDLRSLTSKIPNSNLRILALNELSTQVRFIEGFIKLLERALKPLIQLTGQQSTVNQKKRVKRQIQGLVSPTRRV